MPFTRGRAVVVDRDRKIDARTTAHPLAKTTVEIDREIVALTTRTTKCDRDAVAVVRTSPAERHRLAIIFADLLMADLAGNPPQE